MKKKITLITLSLVVMLIITKKAHAEVDCSSVTGGVPGFTGPIPISFTFSSLNDFTEELHGNVHQFYEESVWELGGGLTGFNTVFMSVISLDRGGNTIVYGKAIGTDVEYQGRRGGISGNFHGRVDRSTGGYEEFDILKGEGGLSGLTIKLFIPAQEESTTPSGDLIIWGCATIREN